MLEPNPNAHFDDFDTHISPEELMDDNPIDEDYGQDFYEDFDNSRDEFYENDLDNWEEEQVFQDREWE